MPDAQCTVPFAPPGRTAKPRGQSGLVRPKPPGRSHAAKADVSIPGEGMMRQAFAGLAAAVVVTGLVAAQAPRDARPVAPAEPATSGVVLGDLTWPEAEKRLTDSSVVVIPLGLATEQHGPHLRLNNKER